MSGTDEELPLDPDLEAAESDAGAPRAIHLRAGALLLVFIGGTIGTAAREALSLTFPPIGGIPYAIFGINIVGALLLGVLLEALVRRGPDHGTRQHLRLLLGTGVLGGFTTYSALATDAAHLIGAGAVGAGLAYGIGTVVVGAVATGCGIALASAIHRRGSRAAGGQR